MSLTNQIARTIVNGFNAMHADFQNITLGAKARFEHDNWHAVDKAQRDRLNVYADKVNNLLNLLSNLAGEHIYDLKSWELVREQFVNLTQSSVNIEIAESFYNSVFRKFFKLTDLNDKTAFVFDTIEVNESDLPQIVSFNYQVQQREVNHTQIEALFDNFQFNTEFDDLDNRIERLCDAIDKAVGEQSTDKSIVIKVLNTVFYRNKGAYLLGTIELENSTQNTTTLPFAISLIKTNWCPSTGCTLPKENSTTPTPILIDAFIDDIDQISIIFSFSRTYFMVDSEKPSEIVNFIKLILPLKKTYELYASIGYRRHSKSLFHRDFLNHLLRTDEEFILAPGIKGMVMSVFTLPSHDVVFKIIKDKFTPPKTVTHKIVKEKYSLVTTNDRAGRLADTQEFFHYRMPLKRFSKELLDELYLVAPSVFSIEGDDIILHHVYTERKMIPLNIYLSDADDDSTQKVMDDYGKSIKEMAAANIFPGDMLLKNFGVTRHDRVIFYDYDEICYMTECNFRAIPEPKTEEQEMASQPWYKVGENDIFPEEFGLFFSGNPKAKKAFETLHSDIYEAKTWKHIQQQIIDDITPDVFPYLDKFRL